MNGYTCTKAWYSFAYENPRLIKPVHHAIIHWIFEKANESEWESEFQVKTIEACRVLGISDRDTYQKAFKDLVKFGAVRIVQEAQGLYVARWVSLEKCSIYLPKKPAGKRVGKQVSTTVGTPASATVGTTPIIKPIETLETTITEVIETSETKKENFDDDDVPEFVKKNRQDLEDQMANTPPVATPPPNWDQVPGLIKGAVRTKELNCMKNNISIYQFDQAVEEFCITKSEIGEAIKSEKDIKQHFFNWLPGWVSRELSKSQKPDPTKGKFQTSVEGTRSAVDEIRRLRGINQN